MERSKTRRRQRGLLEGNGYYAIWAILLFLGIFSLLPRKNMGFKDFKVDSKIQITGSLSMPDRSGQAKISFGQGALYQGGLKEGRFQGPGTVTYPDGRRLEAEFESGSIQWGRMSLKDGQGWEKKEDGNWEQLTK